MAEEKPSLKKFEDLLSDLGGAGKEAGSLFDVLRPAEESPAAPGAPAAKPPEGPAESAPPRDVASERLRDGAETAAQERLRETQALWERDLSALKAQVEASLAAASLSQARHQEEQARLHALEESWGRELTARVEAAQAAAQKRIAQLELQVSNLKEGIPQGLEVRLTQMRDAWKAELQGFARTLEGGAAEKRLAARIERLQATTDALERKGSEERDRAHALETAQAAQQEERRNEASGLKEELRKLSARSGASAQEAELRARGQEEQARRGQELHEELKREADERFAALETLVSELRGLRPSFEADLKRQQEYLESELAARVDAAGRPFDKRVENLEALALGLQEQLSARFETRLKELRADWESSLQEIDQRLDSGDADQRVAAQLETLRSRATELEQNSAALEQRRQKESDEFKAGLQRLALAAQVQLEYRRLQDETDKRISQLAAAVEDLGRLAPRTEERFREQEARWDGALAERLEKALQAPQERIEQVATQSRELQAQASAQVETRVEELRSDHEARLKALSQAIESDDVEKRLTDRLDAIQDQASRLAERFDAESRKEENLESVLSAREETHLKEMAAVKTELQLLAESSETRAAANDRDRALAREGAETMRSLQNALQSLSDSLSGVKQRFDDESKTLRESLDSTRRQLEQRADQTATRSLDLRAQTSARVESRLEQMKSAWESAFKDFSVQLEEGGAGKLFASQVEALQAKAVELEERGEAQRKKEEALETALAAKEEERIKESAALKAKLQMLAQLSEARLSAREREREAAKEAAQTARALQRKIEDLSESLAAVQRELEALRRASRAGV